MSWLRTLRARQLSLDGQHGAALAMCNLTDIPVLSRAGMHLAVLDLASKPSVEHALALVQVGQIDPAVDMAREFAAKPAARALLGFLAIHRPGDILRMIRNLPDHENLRAYCRCALGDAEFGFDSGGDLSPLHAMDLALRAARSDIAATHFARLFAEAGLAIPQVEWFSQGLDYASLACGPAQALAPDGPLISVILTAHNEEAFLPVAARSILQQDWRHLELILVDDASHDRTAAVAQALALQDHRVRVMRLPENVGTWRAKNLALQDARGAFVTMHDADDWSHPAKLSRQVIPLLENLGLACTSSSFFRVDEETGRPFTRNARSYVRWNPSSLLFRREVIERIGCYQDGLLGGDCEFAARIELFFGHGSHLRIGAPLAVGLQRRRSLSGRFRGTQSGQGSMLRLQHWDWWRRQHAVAARGGASRLPTMETPGATEIACSKGRA